MCRFDGKDKILKGFTPFSSPFMPHPRIKLVFVLFGLLLGSNLSVAGPADSTVQMTAAQFGTPTTESIKIPGGSSKVASRTGAFEYNYAIVVPPGRLGVQPNLALSYSSQGAIYGTLAAGWQLSIPEIKVDTSRGKRVTGSTDNNLRWVSSLSGGHRLVPVDEPSGQTAGSDLGPYRAIYDDAYIRYERFSEGDRKQWRARSLDGSIHVFGEADGHITFGDGTSSFTISNIIENQRAPLTHTEDRFGNRVDYYYSVRFLVVNRDLLASMRLERIEYTKNPTVSVDGVDHHAEVRFSYGDTGDSICNGSVPLPVGSSQSDRGQGITWISGAHRLDEVTTHTYADGEFATVGRYELAYTEKCSNHAGATRFLTSISASAPANIKTPSGAWISHPPVTFAYGDPEPQYGSSVNMSIQSNMGKGFVNPAVEGYTPITNAVEWGVRRPKSNSFSDKHTIQAKMIDLDGDGILDRIQSDNTGPNNVCKVAWEPGSIKQGGLTDEPVYEISKNDSRAQVFSLPRINEWLENTVHWEPHNEYCSISGNFNEAKNEIYSCDGRDIEHLGNHLAYRFMDVNSDGLPDLVTGFSYDPGHYNPRVPNFVNPDPDEDPPHIGGGYVSPAAMRSVMAKSLQCAKPEAKLGYRDTEQGGCQLDDDILTPLLSRIAATGGLWSGSWDQDAACGRHNDNSDCVAFATNTGDGDGVDCDTVRTDLASGHNCGFPSSCGTSPDACDVHTSCQGGLKGTKWCGDGQPGGGGDVCVGIGCIDEPITDVCIEKSKNHTSVGRKSYRYKGQYVLRWYRNQGPEKGFFDLDKPKIMLSPIELDMDGGHGPVQLTSGAFAKGRMGSGPIGEQGAFIDINGDGYIDTVRPDTGAWQVHLGDGKGHFKENPATRTPYLWSVPTFGNPPDSPRTSGSFSNITGKDPDLISESEPNPWKHRTFTTSMLVDMNGDGLVDLLYFDRKSKLSSVHLNTGSGFKFSNWRASPALAAQLKLNLDNVEELLAPLHTSIPPALPVHIPPALNAGSITNIFGSDVAAKINLKDIDSNSLIRIVDWDQDGRPDLLAGHKFETVDPISIAPFSHPSAFIPGTPVNPLDNRELWKLYVNDGNAPLIYRGAPLATDTGDLAIIANHGDVRWWISSDFIDVTGDGIPEQVIFNNGSDQPTVTGINLSGGIPRLMKSIDNGHGYIREVTYKAHNDPRVATTSQTEGVGMPHHVWVVEEVKALDRVGDRIMVINFKYGDPVWNQVRHSEWNKLEPGRYGFRGFTSIETSAPHADNATTGFTVTKQKYDYDVDWSGRGIGAVVYANGFPKGDGSDEAVLVSTTQWIERSLFDDKSLSYAKNRENTRRCETDIGTFKDENTCNSSPITDETLYWNFYLRNHTTNTGPALASAALKIWTTPTGQYTDYYKEDSILNEDIVRLFSDNNRYHLMTTGKIRKRATGSNHEVVSATDFIPDPTGRFYVEEQVHLDNSSTMPLTTASTRNSNTGLLTSLQKPNHYPSGKNTIYGYAGFQIISSSETNELDQTATSETDLATGQVTRTTTPNIIICTQGSGPAGTESEYDGFGRPLKIYRYGCWRDHLYGPILVFRFEYSNYNGVDPTRVRAFARINFTNEEAEREIYYDGLGRTVGDRILTDSGDSNSFYDYGTNGKLRHFSVPNPSVNSDTQRSEFTFKYDSLGRQIGMRVADLSGAAPDPDNTSSWDSFAGVDIHYGIVSGQTRKTTTEHATDSSIIGEAFTLHNNFGQLTRAGELLDNDNYATTIYEYDGNSNLNKITDADHFVTEMQHDLANRRTKIIRGDREWKYGYDKNNNLVLGTSPVPGGATETDYQTVITYDALDRIDSVQAASRNLSSPDQSLFGTNRKTTYIYHDNGNNDVGRLSSVTGPFYKRQYFYDTAGRIAREEMSYDLSDTGVSGLISNMKSRSFEYNVAGDLTAVTTADGQKLIYEYDSARRQNAVFWERHSLQPGTNAETVDIIEVARFTRNVAGSVTSRQSPCVERSWTYDRLGRITKTDIDATLNTTCPFAGGATGPLMSETMTYYDTNEVKTQTMQRDGLTPRIFTYHYDSRHQLTAAADDLGEYDGHFRYSEAGRILGAKIGEVANAPLVIGRDVGYNYGDHTAVDGHAVEALTNSANDSVHTAYSYDLSGNVVKRHEETPNKTWAFLYDGNDQQRMALGPDSNDELYYYDENGQRYLSVQRSANGTVIRSKHWFGDSEFWYDANGAVKKALTRMTLGTTSVARIDNENGQQDLEYSFHNGLSHLMGAVDPSTPTPTLTTAYVYGPFGEILDQSGRTDDHLRRFNGKDFDQLSGLSYYGYRYYDPLSLTWMQADPLYRVAPDHAGAQPRKMSLYAFSLNNPLRYLDPDGRDVIIVYGNNGYADKGNINKRIKMAKQLKSELVNPIDKSAASLSFSSVHIVSFDQLQDKVSALHDKGTKIGAIIPFAHGGRGVIKPEADSLPSDLTLEEVAELGGLEIGGAFVSFSCLSCRGRSDFSYFTKRDIEFGGTNDYIHKQKSGSVGTGTYAVNEKTVQPSEWRPDGGTEGTMGRTTSEIVLTGELRVNGSLFNISPATREQLRKEHAEIDELLREGPPKR